MTTQAWGSGASGAARASSRVGLLLSWLLCSACREQYRVGDLVLVEFDEQECPGYVVNIKSRSRLRVHLNFEGHKWEEDVPADRIRGPASSTSATCQLPRHVAVALGIDALEKKSLEQRAAYRKGDKLRVKWRHGSYPATVIEVLPAGRLRVHYDGYEDAWDETIPVERIVTQTQ